MKLSNWEVKEPQAILTWLQWTIKYWLNYKLVTLDAYSLQKFSDA